MPFFTRVFRGKDSTKKAAKSPAIEHDPTPPRPSWTDAWQRTEVAPEEVQVCVKRAIGKEESIVAWCVLRHSSCLEGVLTSMDLG